MVTWRYKTNRNGCNGYILGYNEIYDRSQPTIKIGLVQKQAYCGTPHRMGLKISDTADKRIGCQGACVLLGRNPCLYGATWCNGVAICCNWLKYSDVSDPLPWSAFVCSALVHLTVRCYANPHFKWSAKECRKQLACTETNTTNFSGWAAGDLVDDNHDHRAGASWLWW